MRICTFSTNPEHKSKGYSGSAFYELDKWLVHVWITKGRTNSFESERVNCYSIHVYLNGNQMIDGMIYQGHEDYNLLTDWIEKKDDDSIISYCSSKYRMIDFMEALFTAGKAEGRRELRREFKKLFDIDQD